MHDSFNYEEQLIVPLENAASEALRHNRELGERLGRQEGTIKEFRVRMENAERLADELAEALRDLLQHPDASYRSRVAAAQAALARYDEQRQP